MNILNKFIFIKSQSAFHRLRLTSRGALDLRLQAFHSLFTKTGPHQWQPSIQPKVTKMEPFDWWSLLGVQPHMKYCMPTAQTCVYKKEQHYFFMLWQ